MSKEKTFDLPVTNKEALMLDGKCNAEAQVVIDQIKEKLKLIKKSKGLTDEQAELIANIVAHAGENKKIVFKYSNTRRCKVCGKSAGYATYARNSRHHRKGDPNHKKPLIFWGYEFKDSFVRISNYISLGCCNDCFDKVKAPLLKALKKVKAEIPEKLTGKPSKYIKTEKMECKKCGWKGVKEDMKDLRPLLGRGTYKGGCPKCNAKNEFLSNNINHTGKYKLVRVKKGKK